MVDKPGPSINMEIKAIDLKHSIQPTLSNLLFILYPSIFNMGKDIICKILNHISSDSSKVNNTETPTD